MSRGSKIATAVLLVSGFAAGAVLAYYVAKNPESLQAVRGRIDQVFAGTKQKVNGMSEEVALKTARVTNNPQVNRDWVSHQWEAVGY